MPSSSQRLAFLDAMLWCWCSCQLGTSNCSTYRCGSSPTRQHEGRLTAEDKAIEDALTQEITHAADAIRIEGGRYSEAAEEMTNL
jgi:hypothetical protein